MAEDPEKRKARHERHKAKLAADPEAHAKFIARRKEAERKYRAKKNMERESSGPVGKGKPGRIVSLCGWLGW